MWGAPSKFYCGQSGGVPTCLRRGGPGAMAFSTQGAAVTKADTDAGFGKEVGGDLLPVSQVGSSGSRGPPLGQCQTQ
jgi:hypothetical protein